MKRFRLFSATFIFCIAIVIAGIVFPAKIKMSFNPAGNYEQEWAKVDSLKKKGLTNTALEKVNQIHDKAIAEKNNVQILKSILNRISLKEAVDEDATFKNISELQSEINTLDFPAKNIAQSVLADLLWDYYQDNRYEILSRSISSENITNDIHFWDVQKFSNSCKELYLLSLSDKEKLKAIKISDYEQILTGDKETDVKRPTLYDFLANKAIDFFSTDEPELAMAVNRFTTNNIIYFASPQNFSNADIKDTDSSYKFLAVKLMQELTKEHLSKSTDALFDINLKRLKFAQRSSNLEEKDSLYEAAIIAMINAYSTNSAAADYSCELASWYVSKQSQNILNNKKALQLCENVKNKFPDGAAAKKCAYLARQIETKVLNLTTESVVVPEELFVGSLQYKNVKKCYTRVIKIDLSVYNALAYKNDAQEKQLQYLLDKPYVFTEEIALPGDTLYNINSVEYKLPALPFGSYAILLGTSKSFSRNNEGVSISLITSSNISYLLRNRDNGSLSLYVTERKSGNPVKGATAKIFSEKYDYKTSKYIPYNHRTQLTDKNGQIFIKANNNYEYTKFDLINGKDTLRSTQSYYQYDYGRGQTQKYINSFLFTDRSIYRPGQKVYFKGIVLEREKDKSEIKPGYKVRVSLYDVNYQVVKTEEFTTNEFGSYNGSMDIPEGLLNGQMHIGDGHGEVYFSVEEYKRPSFTSKLLKNNLKQFVIGDSVSVNGKSESFSGVPVDGATVKYSISRLPNYTRWYYRCFGYVAPAETVITSGAISTNDTGGFVIKFAALPDLKLKEKDCAYYTYKTEIKITDVSGETQSISDNINVGFSEAHLQISGNDLLDLSNKEDKIYFNALSYNNDNVDKEIKIKAVRLQQPKTCYKQRRGRKPTQTIYTKAQWESWFPYNEFDEESNRENWKEQETAFEKTYRTNEKPVEMETSMLNLKQGYYKLKCSSKDKRGKEILEDKIVMVCNSDDKEFGLSEMVFNKLLTPEVLVGGKAKLLIGSAENVFVLVEKEVKPTDDTYEGKIVSREWININKAQKIIEFPVSELEKGGFGIHVSAVKNNRMYTQTFNVSVPFRDKELDVKFSTFRNKLEPGQEETWSISVKGANKEKVSAELLATMYDASLDKIKYHGWNFSIYNYFYAGSSLSGSNSFNDASGYLYGKWAPYPIYPKHFNYRSLNRFDYNSNRYYKNNNYRWENEGSEMAGDILEEVTVTKSSGLKGRAMDQKVSANKEAAFATQTASAPDMDGNYDKAAEKKMDETVSTGESQNNGKDSPPPAIRSNFAETAFFLPAQYTNDSGIVTLTFKVPESLTKYKVMAMAYTKDLKIGQTSEEAVTQKDLMVTINSPRFLTEGDEIFLSAKVKNQTAKNVNSKCRIKLYDALTNNEITGRLLDKNEKSQKEIMIKAMQGDVASWKIMVPYGTGPLRYSVTAETENKSDGEEYTIPVLSSSILVTETLPLFVRSNQEKTFKLEKLINQNAGSTTMRNYSLTLEYTSNPAWLAIQALPYLMQYPYDCAEQIFSKYYSNALAANLVNSAPQIKQVFEAWEKKGSESLLSNLSKNEELKSALLQETPWVMEAKSEAEQKKNISVLFNLHRIAKEQRKSLNKLLDMQEANGAWPWFKGMPEDRYITQHILAGMGHLDKLGVKEIKTKGDLYEKMQRTCAYVDKKILEDYEYMLKYKVKLDQNNLSYIQIHYLYSRSFFKDFPIAKSSQKAFDYYLSQAKKYWLPQNKYMQAMIALSLSRYNDAITATDILKSIKDNAINSEEFGMYFKENEESYYWYNSNIESQAMIIEAFSDITNDIKTVDELRIWLIKHKQTERWPTTRSTTEACYALLLNGSNWLQTTANTNIQLGTGTFISTNDKELKTEAGTGYFKKRFAADEIKPEMGTVKLSSQNKTVSYGALYWQYFEEVDKITASAGGTKIRKQLFVEKQTAKGKIIESIKENDVVNIGDKIKVRLELTTDRALEYVHLKDARPACCEPMNSLSGYSWKNGVGCYQSTKDASENFFFDHVAKGSYVFEYTLFATQKGKFKGGIATAQCMYAPEFAAHSAGVKLIVK